MSRNIIIHQNEYIYFHIKPITFLLHTLLLSQKKLHLLYNFHQQNVKTIILVKQTKIEIQNESKPIVATSVSKVVTEKECVFNGISFID